MTWGQAQSITIKVWNRVEFPERLTSFYVFVSDVPFTSTNLTTTQNQAGVSSYYTAGQCGCPTELAINRTGRYIRVQLAGTNYLSIAEVQVWTGTTTPPVQWLISDHLGTPRMILDHTGSLANVKRHDYLPFGEELFVGTGGRTIAQGDSGDSVRQQFTSKERDTETGLDYFLARYYSSVQGRFTAPDEFTGGPSELFSFAATASGNPTFYADPSDPQSLNKYQYTSNNPLAYVDPNGHDHISAETGKKAQQVGVDVVNGQVCLVVKFSGNGFSLCRLLNVDHVSSLIRSRVLNCEK